MVVAEVEAFWNPLTKEWQTAVFADEPEADSAVGNLSRPIGAASDRPAQRLMLQVSRTLRGVSADEIEVDKPSGDYLLVPGHRGAFLLASGESRPVILGRYGPDAFTVAQIEDALAVGADNPS